MISVIVIVINVWMLSISLGVLMISIHSKFLLNHKMLHDNVISNKQLFTIDYMQQLITISEYNTIIRFVAKQAIIWLSTLVVISILFFNVSVNIKGLYVTVLSFGYAIIGFITIPKAIRVVELVHPVILINQTIQQLFKYFLDKK